MEHLTVEEVEAAIRLDEYLRKQDGRKRRRRSLRKVAAFATLPFGGALIVPEDWWKGNSRG